MLFYATFIFYLLYRLYELSIAKRNEKKLGHPEEVGQQQRFFMVSLHSFWFVTMLIEYLAQQKHQLFYPSFVIPVLLLCILVRYLSMKQLGDYWNTKIFKIKGQPIIATGMYRYLRHPNYMIVVIEIIAIPLLFSLYQTAFILGFINLYFIIIRSRLENEVLHENI